MCKQEYYSSIKNEWNLVIWNTDGPIEYQAKWNSQTEKDKHHDFTYMWNVENNSNEQMQKKQSYRHREQTVGRVKGSRGMNELSELD